MTPNKWLSIFLIVVAALSIFIGTDKETLTPIILAFMLSVMAVIWWVWPTQFTEALRRRNKKDEENGKPRDN